MTKPILLSKYSIGVGDRFAHQAKAQLRACMMAAEAGVEVIPVWNKSNREHTIIGSDPRSTRKAADEAVKALNWNRPYHVDADHINLKTVDRFAEPCDFFTIDVADLIGSAAANKYLAAVQEAGRIYRHIEAVKGKGNFITEISMDETDSPQTPEELLIILRAIADEAIPIQTIAPKFTGRFNKGVDYEGDLAKFAKEFSDDVTVIAHAVQQHGLPKNLKLSVHSGSDKFSIYQPIREAMRKFDAGVHLKTAGTTWLEELIGLAEAGGSGLELAKEIYAEAYSHREELCAPYTAVIDIDPTKLPPPAELNTWSSGQFVSALRHDPKSRAYNSSIRQLLHVGFKVAAKMGDRYLDLVCAMEATVARNVTTNLFDRHIKPLFVGL